MSKSEIKYAIGMLGILALSILLWPFLAVERSTLKGASKDE